MITIEEKNSSRLLTLAYWCRSVFLSGWGGHAVQVLSPSLAWLSIQSFLLAPTQLHHWIEALALGCEEEWIAGWIGSPSENKTEGKKGPVPGSLSSKSQLEEENQLEESPQVIHLNVSLPSPQRQKKTLVSLTRIRFSSNSKAPEWNQPASTSCPLAISEETHLRPSLPMLFLYGKVGRVCLCRVLQIGKVVLQNKRENLRSGPNSQ